MRFPTFLGGSYRAAIVVALLSFVAILLVIHGGALAQTGSGSITLVKVAHPADGTDFYVATALHPLGSFGSEGDGAGQLDNPFAISVGPDGILYVADAANHRIQRFLGAGIVLDDAPVDDGELYKKSVTLFRLPAATYVFTETLPSPFWRLDDVNCTGNTGVHNNKSFTVTLSAGAHVTCTLTNILTLPTLTVNKVVEGDGPLSAKDFVLFVDGNAVTRGAANSLSAGKHTVTESGDPDYVAAFSGDCDSSGVVDLAMGNNLTCTITNTYVEPEEEFDIYLPGISTK